MDTTIADNSTQQEKIICKYCFTFLIEPVRLNQCQHIVCKEHLVQFLDGTEGYSCPLCPENNEAYENLAEQETQDNNRVCELHTNQELQYYCHDCRILCCVDCQCYLSDKQSGQHHLIKISDESFLNFINESNSNARAKKMDYQKDLAFSKNHAETERNSLSSQAQLLENQISEAKKKISEILISQFVQIMMQFQHNCQLQFQQNPNLLKLNTAIEILDKYISNQNNSTNSDNSNSYDNNNNIDSNISNIREFIDNQKMHDDLKTVCIERCNKFKLSVDYDKLVLNIHDCFKLEPINSLSQSSKVVHPFQSISNIKPFILPPEVKNPIKLEKLKEFLNQVHPTEQTTNEKAKDKAKLFLIKGEPGTGKTTSILYFFATRLEFGNRLYFDTSSSLVDQYKQVLVNQLGYTAKDLEGKSESEIIDLFKLVATKMYPLVIIYDIHSKQESFNLDLVPNDGRHNVILIQNYSTTLLPLKVEELFFFVPTDVIEILPLGEYDSGHYLNQISNVTIVDPLLKAIHCHITHGLYTNIINVCKQLSTNEPLALLLNTLCQDQITSSSNHPNGWSKLSRLIPKKSGKVRVRARVYKFIDPTISFEVNVLDDPKGTKINLLYCTTDGTNYSHLSAEIKKGFLHRAENNIFRANEKNQNLIVDDHDRNVVDIKLTSPTQTLIHIEMFKDCTKESMNMRYNTDVVHCNVGQKVEIKSMNPNFFSSLPKEIYSGLRYEFDGDGAYYPLKYSLYSHGVTEKVPIIINLEWDEAQYQSITSYLPNNFVIYNNKTYRLGKVTSIFQDDNTHTLESDLGLFQTNLQFSSDAPFTTTQKLYNCFFVSGIITLEPNLTLDIPSIQGLASLKIS
ncbi:hypothetical protein CYY_009618 [Polysphondylium violaceum]|uniref:B box-type domain-containing protein n=1 Tax=Polysphondylium violaceum TaxID=133409 RepID=A0A8J4V0D2_9MYCE|nr:hypothetical protein CYY_009618 [Polysphondylium violaceum]